MSLINHEELKKQKKTLGFIQNKLKKDENFKSLFFVRDDEL